MKRVEEEVQMRVRTLEEQQEAKLRKIEEEYASKVTKMQRGVDDKSEKDEQKQDVMLAQVDEVRCCGFSWVVGSLLLFLNYIL